MLVLTKFLLLLCFVFSLQSWADDKADIIWLTADAEDLATFGQAEPHNIATDTDNLLLGTLRQYKIDMVVVPLPRITRLLQSAKNFCVPNRIRTVPRAKDTLFSLPLMLYPGLKLYWLEQNTKLPKALINEKSQLSSLPALFKALPNNVLGLSGGRSYGERFDRQIALVNKRNMFVRGGDHRFSSMVKMLNTNRINYLIEYPTEIKHMVGLIDQPQLLRSVGLADVSRYNIGYISCSKTALNRQYIKDVNKTLRQLYWSDEFYQAHARHINKVDLPSFDRHFEEVFR